MKKLIVLTIMNLVLGIVFTTNLVLYSKQNTVTVPEFLVKNNIYTVDSYSKWLKQNTKYRADFLFTDNWASPETTLRKKRGDCEDFAFLSQKVLKYLGYNSLVLGIKEKKGAHAICVFYYQDSYTIFDNKTLIKTGITNPKVFLIYLQIEYKAKRIQTLIYE
jgi:predicted transglutaminase-like cysteine proteinase